MFVVSVQNTSPLCNGTSFYIFVNHSLVIASSSCAFHGYCSSNGRSKWNRRKKNSIKLNPTRQKQLHSRKKSSSKWNQIEFFPFKYINIYTTKVFPLKKKIVHFFFGISKIMLSQIVCVCVSVHRWAYEFNWTLTKYKLDTEWINKVVNEEFILSRLLKTRTTTTTNK